jgi:hypothetical protein
LPANPLLIQTVAPSLDKVIDAAKGDEKVYWQSIKDALYSPTTGGRRNRNRRAHTRSRRNRRSTKKNRN